MSASTMLCQMTLPMTYKKSFILVGCVFFFPCFAVDVFFCARAHENHSRHQKSELIKRSTHARRWNNKLWPEFPQDHIVARGALYVPAIDNAFTSERNQHQFRALQYHSVPAFGSHILCDSKRTSIAHEKSIPALVPLHLHRLWCGVEAVSRRKSRIASISFWIRSRWMVPAKNGKKTRIKFVTVAVLLFISFAPPIAFLMHSSG